MKKKISPQKKSECINYALSHPEISLEQLAKDFGIGYSTLHKWIREARAAGLEGVQRELSPEQKRIVQLEKEVSHLREVNEIIKKAHVYFVNNPSR
jgi:transposase-like protein